MAKVAKKTKSIDVSAIARRNKKAVEALQLKKAEKIEKLKQDIAAGRKKRAGRPRIHPAPDPNAPKRPPGRPKKIRTPEEQAEIDRRKAEAKARGRGRPRINPLPTPEEIAAKEKRKKERAARAKANERKKITKALKRGDVITGSVLKKDEAPVKGRSFNVSAAGGGGGRRGKATTAEKKVEAMMSAFHQEFADIKKMIGSEADDFQNDKSTLAMLRAMLSMSTELVPVAEAAYRDKPNNFNMSALANLCNQIRELQNDIRNLQDLEQQIEHINREIIQPGVRQMADFLISETFKLKKELGFYIKKPSVRRLLWAYVDTMASNMGKAMSRQTVDMGERVRKYLVE